jgi:integrase
VVSTIERAYGRYQVVEYGKTKAARRTLKMPEFLREVLAWHLKVFKRDEWVFPAPVGGFLRYDNFRNRAWLPAVQKAGLAPLTFHELRHTAAAFMINDGADPLQVKRRMGHEDIRTTFDTYGHLFPDREEDLVAALGRRRAAAKADGELQLREGELIDFKQREPRLE